MSPLLLLGLSSDGASAEVQEVNDGTTLLDLGLVEGVRLGAGSQTEYRLDGFRVPESHTNPDEDLSLVLDASLVFELDRVPVLSEDEEARLSFSLNGRAIIQMRVIYVDGVARIRGGGWVDGDPNAVLVPGTPTRIEFANYLQYTSALGGGDELSVTLDVGEVLSPHLSVTLLPESRFVFDVNPARIVTLDIESVDVDSVPGEAHVGYRVRSEREAPVSISLVNTVGLDGEMRNYNARGELTSELLVEGGQAVGTAVVGLSDGSSIARGTLLVTTDWNSPAETFTIGAAPDRALINWPVVTALALATLGFGGLRARQARRA
ncbi:MAG: hypothetical protein AAGA65_26455 [Actinomycetota bacterium]